MKKCKFCSSILGESENVCPVCRIEETKTKADLTKDEKRVTYFCGAIRVIGSIHRIFALFFTVLFLIALILAIVDSSLGSLVSLRTGISASKSMHTIFSVNILLKCIGGIIFAFVFGTALQKYKKWSFYGAIFIYGSGFLYNIIRLKLVGLLLPGIILYHIVNPISRKILLRK